MAHLSLLFDVNGAAKIWFGSVTQHRSLDVRRQTRTDGQCMPKWWMSTRASSRTGVHTDTGTLARLKSMSCLASGPIADQDGRFDITVLHDCIKRRHMKPLLYQDHLLATTATPEDEASLAIFTQTLNMLVSVSLSLRLFALSIFPPSLNRACRTSSPISRSFPSNFLVHLHLCLMHLNGGWLNGFDNYISRPEMYTGAPSKQYHKHSHYR